MFTLDTNTIIYYLKDDSVVCKFIRKQILIGSRFFISTISEAELFGYPEMTFEEFSKIDKLLATIPTIPIDSQIARLAGYFRRAYGVKLPDAIIAATAFLTNSTLITRNIKDFNKIQDIKVRAI